MGCTKNKEFLDLIEKMQELNMPIESILKVYYYEDHGIKNPVAYAKRCIYNFLQDNKNNKPIFYEIDKHEWDTAEFVLHSNIVDINNNNDHFNINIVLEILNNKIPAEKREIIKDRIYHGLKFKEIATKNKKSTSAIKHLYYNGLKEINNIYFKKNKK